MDDYISFSAIWIDKIEINLGIYQNFYEALGVIEKKIREKLTFSGVYNDDLKYHELTTLYYDIFKKFPSYEIRIIRQ
jgi:hypothetical protein